MKIQQSLPITNLKVQPPATPSFLRGKLPLQELQQADVFFSSSSIRAQMREILQPDVTTRLVKMFNFTPSTSTWWPFTQTSHPSALIIEKNALPQIEPPPTTESSPEIIKPDTISNLKAHWVDYSTTLKPDFLLRVYQLPFAKPSLKPDFTENRVAYIEKTGTLLSGPQIQQAGIVETYRPHLEKFLHWLKGSLPPGDLFKRLFDISSDGTVKLLNRWELNWVRHYRDSAGNPVKFYDIAKLANNMIVKVEKKELLAEGNSLDATSKKAFKEAVLARIEQAEREGNHLLPEAVPHNAQPTTPPIETAKPTTPVSNPFMTNPFALKASSSFIPTKVADTAPPES